jgi:hypothetical protein
VNEKRQHLGLRAARAVASGAANDDVLRELRSSGATMADCVAILADARNIDMSEAQRVVVNSEVWQDHRASYLRLEAEFWKEAEKLGERQPDGSIRIDLNK